MKHLRLLSFAIASSVATVAAADTIKVGVIGPMSGPSAIVGQSFEWGINAYVEMNGETVGDHEVEFIFKDLSAVDPAKARALAQELVVGEGVQYLAGAFYTPNAMAITPLLESARTPFVILNAATSTITQSSPYVLRTSYTMWQNAVPAALAAREDGVTRAVTVVSDYAPGHDAEQGFAQTFEAEGGEIVDSIRLPLSTADFNPVMQRIKDSGADGVFVFTPAGSPALSFMRAFDGNGLKDAGVSIISTGDVVTETDLAAMGDPILGIKTTYHYSAAHPSDENRAFLDAIEASGGNVDLTSMFAVAAFDGAKVIYDMIAATDGAQDPEAAIAAVVGQSWESPRGPVTIDAETRHITQNVYVRQVENVDGKLQNTEIGVFEAQPDWGLVER
ncbi:MAG: ABC transporter substrate-binding protein [Pseudomonadota bacterium]|nr:ABC transporter substrate-binding protein [Pseudomonadota bacterium]